MKDFNWFSLLTWLYFSLIVGGFVLYALLVYGVTYYTAIDEIHTCESTGRYFPLNENAKNTDVVNGTEYARCCIWVEVSS